MHFISALYSAHQRSSTPQPITTPNTDLRIFSKSEFINLELDEESKKILNFLEINKILESINCLNKRFDCKKHYIYICSPLNQSGIDVHQKAQLHILKNNTFIPWDDFEAQFHYCDLNDLNSERPLPKNKVAVDRATLRLLNGGYTTAGIRIDQNRPTFEGASEQSLFEELIALNDKKDDSLKKYIQNLIVFENREVEGGLENWSCEIITYSSPEYVLFGSHSSIRLISPWGQVISVGWWRYDNLASKANQRGILHCPDPIEMEIGDECQESQQGPIHILSGHIDAHCAIKMLAKLIFLHRYPSQFHHYSISGNENLDRAKVKRGINCADFQLELLQLCLPSLDRSKCSITLNSYLASSLFPLEWDKTPLGAYIFKQIIIPAVQRGGGFSLYSLLLRHFKLYDISEQLKRIGGRPLINSALDYGKNFHTVAPEMIYNQLCMYMQNANGESKNEPNSLHLIKCKMHKSTSIKWY